MKDKQALRAASAIGDDALQKQSKAMLALIHLPMAVHNNECNGLERDLKLEISRVVIHLQTVNPFRQEFFMLKITAALAHRMQYFGSLKFNIPPVWIDT